MDKKKLNIIYFKKAILNFLSHISVKSIFYYFKYYKTWLQDITSNRSTLSDRKPWITYPAIDFLQTILKSDMNVFEYGSGGSTFYFADNARHVISIEHDEKWYYSVKNKLQNENVRNVEYFLLKPIQGKSTLINKNGAEYDSQDENFIGYSFESYVKAVDKYPDNHFDLIIIDGRSRTSCIAHSINKIKEGGYLIVDNSERKYYLEPFDFDKNNWNRMDFAGPVPFSYDFSKTTIFQKVK